MLIKSFFILLFRSSDFPPHTRMMKPYPSTTIMTRHDFEIVLNHFLLDFYEMEIDFIDSMPRVTIKNKLPFLLQYKFRKMKKHVEYNKIIGIFVDYK